MDLKDKVVLITGGTRGIGYQTAVAFAKAGSKVIINARHDFPKELSQQLEEIGVKPVFLKADLADPEQATQLAKDAWQQYDRIDVLVNNAGIAKDALMIGMKTADFDTVMNVNVRGPFTLTKAVLKKMYKKRSGSIINLASVVGLHGNIGQANYAASKAAVIGLTKTVAKEGALRGIRCNAVAPGMIDSDMTKQLSARVKKQILDQIPLGRFGQSAEVAQTILFLAKNDYVTGQTFVVDGGMTI